MHSVHLLRPEAAGYRRGKNRESFELVLHRLQGPVFLSLDNQHVATNLPAFFSVACNACAIVENYVMLHCGCEMGTVCAGGRVLELRTSAQEQKGDGDECNIRIRCASRATSSALSCEDQQFWLGTQACSRIYPPYVVDTRKTFG